MTGRPLRCLIVEDSDDDTLLLVRHLTKEGFNIHHERVETARAMSDALDRQEWDVVLADYNLPTFSAPEALHLLQQKRRNVPFIVLSGAVGEESAVALMRAGAHDFFVKGNLILLGAAINRELEALRQANTAKDRLLATLAHELRNPMAGLKGIPSLLRRRLAAGRPLGDIVEMTAMMEQEVDRVSSLLDEVLDAFRSQQGHLVLKRKRTDLAHVITSALRPYRVASERHRFTLVGLEQEPVWVWGDARRLEDVVRNLLSNALKYSPQGGEIQIALRTAGGCATVSIRDEGLGVPVDQLSEIFEGFYRGSNIASSEIGGLGLGLYTCRDIIVGHKGRIWAQNQEAGATFRFELPLCAAVPTDLEGSTWPAS